MKVQYEYDGYPRLINFDVVESSTGFLCTLKTTKDRDKIVEIIDNSSDKNIIENELKSHIEGILNLPLLIDKDHEEDGYNLKIRMDMLIREL